MRPITIVVADDHPLILKGFSDYFNKKREIQVLQSCASGDEALEAILSLQPDVALLDVRMPGKNGFDVLAKLNRAQSPTKVIFLTGAMEANDIFEAAAEGSYGLLSKDCEPDDILTAIRNAIKGQRTYPVEVAGTNEPDKIYKPIDQILSQRQWKVMSFAARGLSNKEIALKLNITEGTAKVHLHQVFRKLGVRTRTALANLSVRTRNKDSAE